MEELERLISNFEFDRRKAGTLDESLQYFLKDLQDMINDLSTERSDEQEEELEKAKEEAYDDGCRSVIDAVENKISGFKNEIESILYGLMDKADDIVEGIERMHF